MASDPVFTLVYTVCVNRGVNRQKAMDATISVICFKSKTLANGEHPLMLRITKDRKRTMKSLGGKHGKIDPVGTDEIDPVKTA